MITDDQAIKLANSQQWFDNQANTVDWVAKKPCKFNKKTASTEELLSSYRKVALEIKDMRDIEREAKISLGDALSKKIRFVVILKQELSARGINTASYSDDNKELRDEVKRLTKKNESLSEEIKKRHQGDLDRIQRERKKEFHAVVERDRDYHLLTQLKAILKVELGYKKYIEIIQKAGGLADEIIAHKANNK